MKNKGFWFGVMLTLSILAVVWCFEYADSCRGYNSTGSEVFMLALPLWIVHRKVAMMGQKIQKLKKYNRELHNYIQ